MSLYVQVCLNVYLCCECVHVWEFVYVYECVSVRKCVHVCLCVGVCGSVYVWEGPAFSMGFPVAVFPTQKRLCPRSVQPVPAPGA